MAQNIRGIDVSFEYADGTTLKGHISPIGVHIDRRQAGDLEEARNALELMRSSIVASLKPYNKAN